MNNKQRNVKANLAASYNDLIQSFTALSVETVGNYSIGKVVGKGTYGKAYQGTHKFVGGKVVLKSTPKSEAPNLAREIHHHRRLHHANITQLYEVIITESKVWLVLELCAGGELYDHLLSKKCLDEEETQRLFAQICGAVAYVHSCGVVHRDLKLENIFLDRKGNAKLGDFGFTRENDKTLLSTWCGSLLYCAPEIVRGDKYSGSAVDIWSLGVILFALLSGHLPFDDDDESTTKKRILLDQPKYPEHFSTPARQLLEKMLSKNPDLRPSAREVLEDPFLSFYADAQVQQLEHPFSPTFTTKLERTILERIATAGVDTDRLISSVSDYRCDALSGWWWLSLQKERRRERKYRALSKRRSVDAATDDIRISHRSRSRGGERPRSGRSQLQDYKFPSADNSRQSSRHHSLEEVPPHLKPSPKPNLITALKSNLNVKVVELPDIQTKKTEDLELTPTNSKRGQVERNNSDSSGRSKELGSRKNSIMQTFKTWWTEQVRSKERQIPKSVPQIQPSYVSSPSISSSRPDLRARRSTSANRLHRPAYARRSSSYQSQRGPHRKRNPHLLIHVPPSDKLNRSPSPARSVSSSKASLARPSMRRTTSASSNHSNTSLHSHRNLYSSHSKASSTSSNSTFASTRSIRSPRNPLKVLPSTPPPFAIPHPGAKEKNIFESKFGREGISFATRKKNNRAILPNKKPRRSILLNEVEEEDEEADDFVDEETVIQYAGDTTMITTSRSLLDLQEVEEHE